MQLTTLTKREQEWLDRARKAVEDKEEWERCEECRRYHPAGYDGDCDDPKYRLPRLPVHIVG